MLEARGLKQRFAERWVVEDVSLIVGRGEIVGLLGPNGAGKTVTFYMISGLLQPTAGRILIDGHDVTDMPMHRRARCGLTYLSQERSVFHRLSASENIAGVLEMHGYSRRDAQHRAVHLLARFGLARLADTQAAHLSGGEQRRLEVARAVATTPNYLLSDEPFTGIDPKTIEMLHALFTTLRSDGMGILLTDHNVTETLALCDRAYVLFAGRVLAHGTPDELSANPLVRRLYLGDADVGGRLTTGALASACRRTAFSLKHVRRTPPPARVSRLPLAGDIRGRGSEQGGRPAERLCQQHTDTDAHEP